ncbi:MAG: glycosyltransferase family 9 protein [Syntrophorhabdaceae bacterium]|nr:glycosyltransferase family 9 protein [Syntrophorhabdaceae bacterium]
MTGKTIIYLPNWIGDMVMAIPFLKSIRASLNDELWALGWEKAIHLYNNLGLFDRFIPLKKNGLINFFDMVSELKRHRFKRGVALPHSFRSALTLYLAGIEERIGYSRNKRGLILTHRVPEVKGIESMVEHYLKIIDLIGGSRMDKTPVMATSPDEEERFYKTFNDIHEPYGIFIVGARYGPSKCWPQEHFARLADMIVEIYGIKIYLLPGREEMALAEGVLNKVSRKDAVLIKEMGIRDMKVCLSKASFVVSNDTGPRHISAALSVPTIVLMGPMDERYTDYKNGYTFKIGRDLMCRPCNKKVCDRNMECLYSITPEEVLQTIKQVKR